MTARNPSPPCGMFSPEVDDPHAAAYCNLPHGHGGPHYSILKDTAWEDN